jgi:hypothetical protein
VAGGTVVISLCHFYVLQPGVALREIYVVGGDVLVGERPCSLEFEFLNLGI